MSLKYIIKGECITVGGSLDDTTLSEFEGEVDFVQYFHRAWNAIEFDSPLDCLVKIRELRSGQDVHYVLSEDECSIINVQNDYCFKSYSIKRI